MKISIVTPVLNRAETITDALSSVSAQIHDDIDHVVQDGGSSDGTLEILRNWVRDPAIRWQSQPDRGLYDALNRGISRCRGEVIGLLHSDDILADADVVRDVVDVLADDRFDGAYGDLEMISAAGRVLRHWRAGPFDAKRMRWGWAPPHPTLYLRRDVIERLGAYDSSFRIAGDYDAMLRWIWTGEIRLAYIPRVLVRMRHGGASTGSLSGILTKSREDLSVIRKNRIGGIDTLMAKNLRKLGQFSALVRGPGR